MDKHRKLKIVIIVIVCVAILMSAIVALVTGSKLHNHGIRKIADYMYAIDSEEYNYDMVDALLGLGSVKPGCSAVRNGRVAGRNFDWYIEDNVEFVVTTPGDGERYATMGVASLTGLQNEFVEKGNYSFLYEFLPFYVVDGINEKGLFVSVNMVPGEDVGVTTGSNPDGEKLANVIVARYLLDYAATTEEAVQLLSERNVYGYVDEDGPFEVHWLVADKDRTIAIEFMNNEMVVTEDCNILTNFYVGLDHLTEHSMGFERYDILKDNYATANTVGGMLNLLKMVEYSKYYDTTMEPRWYSESYGEMVAADGEVFGLSSDISKFEPIYLMEAEAYKNHERNGIFWETTHTSVYDLDSLTLSMYVQEGNTVYTEKLTPLTDFQLQAKYNSESRSIIIPMEIVCVIMMFAILYGMLFENQLKDRKSTIFTIVVVGVIIAVLADITAWNYDGIAAKTNVQATSNYIAMIMSEVFAAIFIFYEYEFVREREGKGFGVAMLSVILNSLAVLLLTIGTPLGKTFYFIDGVYYADDWYYISYVMGFLNILFIFILALSNRKVLGTHDTLSFLVYGIIPLITTVIESLNPRLELAYVSIPVAVIIIYILLQSGKVNELHMRHKLLQEISYTDALTGLQNRRAYDETLAKALEGGIGVIFCDANGLKYANDHEGHKAGDALLCRFATILGDNFDSECTFRISGDEFVVIMQKQDEAGFRRVLEKFRSDVAGQGDIASIGCFFGEGDILEMIAAAEKDMYKDKAQFYARHPEQDRRKNTRQTD